MNKENRNDEAVSPVIATILMVAITVVLAGVLYVWASSLAEGNTDGDLTLYVFDAEDAGGDVTTQTDDNLVRVTMTQGSAVNWASVSVKISVNNGAPITCDRDSGDGVRVRRRVGGGRKHGFRPGVQHAVPRRGHERVDRPPRREPSDAPAIDRARDRWCDAL